MNYILSIIILFVFAIIGLSKRNKTTSFKTFLFYDFLLFIIFLAYVLNSVKLNPENTLLNFISLMYFVVCVSIPPTIYIYVKLLSLNFSGYDKSERVLIHYLPSAVLFLINTFSFIYFNISNENHIAYDYINNVMTYSNVIAMYFVFFIQVFFYAYLVIGEYRNYRENVSNIYSFEEGIDFKWIKIFVGGFILVVSLIYLAQTIGDIAKDALSYAIAVYALVINYSALKQEQIHDRLTACTEVTPNLLPDKTYDKETLLIQEVAPQTDNATERAVTGLVDEGFLTQLSLDIKNAMEKDKVFLDPELTLTKLAGILGTNTKYISYCINSMFGKNFSTYINEYRTLEAIRLMETDHISQYTLEAIAELSGFKSRSVFISAFKKMTGKTPSQYKKES